MAERKPRTRTTEREEKAVAAYLGGATQEEALRQNGWSDSFARKRGYQVFERPAVKSLVTDALVKADPTIVERVARKVVGCLDAKKYFPVTTGRGEDKKTEMLERDDFDTQLKACDRVIEAFGAIPGKMEMPAPPRPPISITFIIGKGGTAKPFMDLPKQDKVLTPPKPKPFTVIVKKPSIPVP